MKRILSLTVCAALATMFACGVESSSPQNTSEAPVTSATWTHYSAPVTEDGHEARIEYWVRGTEVVRRYWEEGALLYDERCDGNRLTVRQMLPSGVEGKGPFNYKEVSDRQDAESCFQAATSDELRYLHNPASLSQAEHVQLSDGRAALRWVGTAGAEYTVDAQTSLPIRADYVMEGEVVNLSFGAFSVTTEAASPAAPEVEWTGFQEMLDVPAIEARQGLEQVPETVAGLPFQHAYSFRTQNLTQPTYYLIWGNDDRNVQMVTTVAALPEALLGYSADGTDYNAQDGDRHIKIGTIGGDAELLRAALKVLRPAALDDTRVQHDP
ncbi:hypothetical protein LZC95_51705 [Pendulispora brunnea]|uniref:Lipoprotein n=1 Tax=Pendulispora brunnea TaxID=2905690 RepID=A0ABZ2K861_9BACT